MRGKRRFAVFGMMAALVAGSPLAARKAARRLPARQGHVVRRPPVRQDRIVRKSPVFQNRIVRKAPVFQDRVGRITVWKTSDPPALLFTAGMAIDADGAPNAYHPRDIGLDALEYAGQPGNWWALVTETDRMDGTPILQGPNNPYPGYYISTTSLEDERFRVTDPRRYVDSTRIPYVVLPEQLQGRDGAHLGDLAVVFNTRNRRLSPAIFADTGPRGKLGEGSIALARALRIPADARTGGVERGVVYLVFPGSGDGRPKPLRDMGVEAMRHFNAWGGLPRLRAVTRLSATR